MNNFPITKKFDGCNFDLMHSGDWKKYYEEQTQLRELVNRKKPGTFRNEEFDVDYYHIRVDVGQRGEMFVICRREVPLKKALSDLQTNRAPITSIAELVGIDRRTTGKYGDASKLHEEESAGVELGEVQMASGANN